MLDRALHIHRINSGAQRVLNLGPSDLGRPFGDVRLPFAVDHLDKVIAGVIDNLETREVEVQHQDGRRHMLRIRPYRTTENKIEGAVMVMIDLDQLRK